MTYMDKTLGSHPTAHDDGSGQGSREPFVLVVEDDIRLSETFRVICECLGVAIMRMPSRDDLGAVLRNRRPMTVVAEMDAIGQDGCHVLMTIAAYDRSLPVLLITGPDPALLGAVDAVEEIWALSSVEKWPDLLGVGAIVDFLFRAGRKGRCMRLMSV
jgi:DNA-binding NtrC family response regulator